jgi:hypothetical protein
MSKKPTITTAIEVTPEVTVPVEQAKTVMTTIVEDAPPVVQQDKQYLTARFDKDFLKNGPEKVDVKEPPKTEPRLTSRTRAEMEAGRKSIADYQ